MRTAGDRPPSESNVNGIASSEHDAQASIRCHRQLDTRRSINHDLLLLVAPRTNDRRSIESRRDGHHTSIKDTVIDAGITNDRSVGCRSRSNLRSRRRTATTQANGESEQESSA